MIAAMGQNEAIRLLPFFVLLPGALVALFVGGWIERRRRWRSTPPDEPGCTCDDW